MFRTLVYVLPSFNVFQDYGDRIRNKTPTKPLRRKVKCLRISHDYKKFSLGMGLTYNFLWHFSYFILVSGNISVLHLIFGSELKASK